ncbi:hypothetical protein L3X38_029491 [Prunus dulcis]|uniref:Uncharacterized protein n=1 Tax=Prunus dulcis TaxID=3755 RepID=A0AAD4VTA6_PRUDU|nr:hypothetical protein L3X38_029491 [Prunus dulcis]
MEIPIDFFQYINDQYFDTDDSSDMVKGAHVCFYKLSSNYSRNKSLYDHGELIFKRNGKAIDVSFLNIGDGDEQEQIAEQIFHLHARVSDRILIRPWMIAYCKQNKEGTSGWWSLCYDRFDISLSDWQVKVISEELSDPNKVDLKIGFRCLCDYWCRTIRQLIDLISHIHAEGIFHGSLRTMTSYVFVGDTLKVMNIGGGLKEQDKVAFQDFKDFSRMLRSLFEPFLSCDTQWPELTSFLGCFNTKLQDYPRYVKKLLEHPFLMAPSQRMQYIGELHHKLKSTHSELRQKLNSDDFLEFFDWNEPVAINSLESFFIKVFNYKKNKPYKRRPSDLLKFLRNVYEHCMDRSEKDIEEVDIEEVDIVQVEAAVRKHWGNFLDRVHVLFST